MWRIITVTDENGLTLQMCKISLEKKDSVVVKSTKTSSD